MFWPGNTKNYLILFCPEEKMMDFPSGPLDVYRQKASFSWKEMLNFLEGEDIQAFKVPSSQFSRYHGNAVVFIPPACRSNTCLEPWRTTHCSPAGPARTCPWTG